MIMRMLMIVMMIVAVIMKVVMVVTVAMVMVVLQMGLAARQPRVLAEHQRLDGDGHGHRRQPDAAEIDVVEVP